MRLFLNIFFLIATTGLNAQIEIPIHGAYDGGYGKDKFIKSDSTGWLFIPYSDTSKIIFIAKDYTTYRQFNKQNQLLVEGSFGGKKWTDYFQPYGKWTEYYENGSIKSAGFFFPCRVSET
jgi:hypothetical protein